MRVVLILFVCLLAGNGYASEIFFLSKSNTDAVELATKLNKPFFVFYCGKWCPTCKIMEDHTFQDDDVAAYASSNFLAFKANIDTPEGREWKERYGVYVVPTIIFFDKYGIQQDLHASVLSAQAFLDVMRNNVNSIPTYTSSAPLSNTSSTANPVNAVATPNSIETIEPPIQQQEFSHNNEVAIETTDAEKLYEDSQYEEVIENVLAETQNEIIENATELDLPKPRALKRAKKKKRKRKKKRQDEQEIVDADVSRDLDQVTAENETVKTNEVLPFSETPMSTASKESDIVKQPVPDSQPTETNEVKMVRPKRKTMILNPKKEVVPTNIVIRTERSQPADPSPAPVVEKQVTNVVSMANPPTNYPATNSNVVTKTTAYLQLGYFSDYSNARRLVTNVQNEFYTFNTNLIATIVDGKEIYRVTMTNFETKEQVKQMKVQLKKAGFKSFIFEN